MPLQIGSVQVNAAFSGQRYLPYSIGGLVAYAKRHIKNPENFNFLLPLFDKIPIKEAVAKLIYADLVAFSTYVWNEQLTLEIAKCLKRLKPSIIIVCGGPQIPDPYDEAKPYMPNRAKKYLEENPFVDILCHGEGEKAYLSILENCYGDWENIPSISFRKEGGKFKQTPRAERLKDLSDVPSPYLDDTFKDLMEAYPDIKWIATLETDRGCPYFCTFCGWGSLVGQKVFPFPEVRVYEELDWFGRNFIEFVFARTRISEFFRGTWISRATWWKLRKNMAIRIFSPFKAPKT